MPLPKLTAALTIVLIFAVSSPAATAAGSAQARNVDLLLGDCSSYRSYTKAAIPEMLAVARDTAANRGVLWAGCFDGAPLRTLRWSPKVDFSTMPKEIRQNKRLAERFNVARALGLKPKLEEMVRQTPPRVRGSGQLEVLELAARTPNVRRVFVWTDGAVNQVDGIQLQRATTGQIRRTIKRWAPRLKNLKGVELMFLGVGRGVQDTTTTRRAEDLFRGLARRIGVRSFDWQTELPAKFIAR